MNNKIAGIAILVLGVLFAIILGVDIGTSEYERLSTYFVVAVIIYFFVHGWRNVWWLTTLLVFSGAMFYHGFKFEAEHLFVMMIMLASGMSLISGGTIPQAPEIRRAGSNGTLLISGLLVFYGFLHFAVYFVFPYDATQYSVKTSTKAYFECFASMVCFFWLVGGFYGFNLKRRWDLGVLWIMMFCLSVNVFIRAWMFFSGFQSDLMSSTETNQMYSWHIPVINMYAGVYTLRNITPIITVICLMLLTSPDWWKVQRTWTKILVASLICFSLVGAVLSGGRATLLFCIALALLVAVKRRRVGTLLAAGGCALIFVALINIFSHFINTEAPNFVARSFQFLMIEKGSTYDDISGSQMVRKMAHQQAFIEWQRDDRSFLFGRSVFEVSDEEAEYNRNVLGWDGFVINAMRSGRTHGLISDLVLQYGLFGLVLYISSYIAIIFYVWRLAKVVPVELTASKAIIGAMSLYLPMMFVYQLAGGTFMPLAIPLVVGLVRADLVKYHKLNAKQTISATRGYGNPLPAPQAVRS